MATLKEYFETDFSNYLAVSNTLEFKKTTDDAGPVILAKISKAFDANAKFWSFFIQDVEDFTSVIAFLLSNADIQNCTLPLTGENVIIEAGFSNYSEKSSSQTLKFTGRVFIYIDEDLDETFRNEIKSYGLDKGLHVLVRDREYAMKRSEMERPLAFISHDSRDKDSLVRELALELSKLMCPVWYDEYSLKVGDSLRSSIEAGLKETKKCIVILSPNFLSNEGWGKAEFDSIYTREIIERNNVILPVWHNVDQNDVYDYCPRLADKFGLNSSIGVKEIARKLSNVIKST